MFKKKEKYNGLLEGVSFPPSSRAPRVSLAPKIPFPFPFKRLPRKLFPSFPAALFVLCFYRMYTVKMDFKLNQINQIQLKLFQ